MTIDGPIRDGEVRAYERAGYELVPSSARRVLDVGCGSGEGVLSLAERLGAGTLLIGLDERLERIDEAQRAARNVALNVRFAVGDARSLPFSDGFFDVVRSGALRGAADERARAVRELARVTARGGRVLIHHDAFAAMQEEGTDDDLLSLMQRAGLAPLAEPDSSAPEGRGRGMTLVGIKPARSNEGSDER